MLRVRLVGALEVEIDGTVIQAHPSQRPWALFAYVALAPQPVSRAELASRFWPDVLDSSARASLRSALWVLRRALGDLLVVDGGRVGLRTGRELWVDVREFERLADELQVERALALCRGELLEGVESDWALAAREHHRERMIGLLEHAARTCEEHGDQREAIEWTRRQVTCDPFDEGAHRRLISRLDAAGDRASALRVYRTLAERLRRELKVAPSARTRELVESLVGSREAPGERPVPTVAPGLLTLIGRDRELSALEAAWRAVTTGAGAAAVVRGEAGIGKTRLVSELQVLVCADGGRAVCSAALDLGGSAPLGLWAELISELLPTLRAPPADCCWPEDLAALAGDVPTHFARAGAERGNVAPDLQRMRLFEAVAAALSWAAAERALLLILEDIHAADRPSLELAGYLARRVAGLRVMIVFTRRELPHSPDADGLEHALRSRGLLACEMTLAPLEPAAMATLARQAAQLSDAHVTRVVERADGNPLLGVETARALGRGRGDEVAPSLTGSVRASLAQVSGEVRTLLELAAVAGRALEPIELGQLGFDDADERASRALETGLMVVSGSRLGFGHALLRDATYAQIAAPRRAGLHRRWVDALLAAEHAGVGARPAEVARHLRIAGADRDAVVYLARAAVQARTVAALEQAAGYLQEAIAIAPERSSLWLELGEIEAWQGHREAAETAFQRGLGLVALDTTEPTALVRAWLQRARAYHGSICVPRAVLESCAAALAQLETMTEPAVEEAHEAICGLAWAHAVAGSVDEAERLLATIDVNAPHSDLQTYDVAHARALALMRRGRFVDSYAPAIAAGEAVARAGRPDLAYGCWANAAGAAAAAGEHDRALEFIARGLDAIHRQGLQSLEIHLLAARSFVLTRLGRLDEARRAADSEQRLAEQLAQPDLAAMASHDRGMVALARGDGALAADLLAAALVDGAPISRPLTRLALAEALARSGAPEQAEQQLRETVLEPVRPSDFPEALVPRLTRVQGVLALTRDHPEEAARRLREAIAGWERLVDRARPAQSMTAVLADLGRPVVGLIEPERELAQARAELHALTKGTSHAVVS